MRRFWTNHIDGLWTERIFRILNRTRVPGITDDYVRFEPAYDTFNQVRGQTFWVFHLKTNNLEINHVRSINARHSVSIQSMQFVFPFCMGAVGNILVTVSKNTWEAEATRLSDFSSFLPLRVGHAGLTIRASWAMDARSFFNAQFTLRNLHSRPKTSLLDRGLAEFIFPNTTFIIYSDERCFCCKMNLHHNSSLEKIEPGEGLPFQLFNYELPHLKIDEFSEQFIFTTGGDVFTFLSCGGPYIDPPNFLALFMPYTKTTWTLIFMTILGWPLVLSFIENDFKLKNVLKDFDALFIGWAMILEQSHLRATNYKGRGPLYCYCGCVLLAIFVLSNAYRGDNIQALTRSFEFVPLTHIAQIVKAGYKTYGNKYCPDYSYPLKNEDCLDQFQSIAKGNGFKQTLKQIKIWEPMKYDLMEFRDAKDVQLKVQSFGKCEKKALLDWRRHLIDIEKELRMKHKSADIYLGEEFIFTRRKGWRLRRYGSIKVLKRMWTIVESGVYNKLVNISYKPPAGKTFEPHAVKLQGNIVVQFVFHSFGLLLALLVVIAEFHKSIILCLSAVCGIFGEFIKNFLRQSQKAVLLGFKYVITTRDKLIH